MKIYILLSYIINLLNLNFTTIRSLFLFIINISFTIIDKRIDLWFKKNVLVKFYDWKNRIETMLKN